MNDLVKYNTAFMQITTPKGGTSCHGTEATFEFTTDVYRRGHKGSLIFLLL